MLYPFAHSLQRESTKPLHNSSWSTWGLSFSRSLIIFCCLHLRIHLSLVSRISLLTGCDAMFAYWEFLRNCSLPIALVYTSFIFKSIFLALNTNMPEFCKFLEHGLQYDNNTVNFTVRPCCFFSKRYKIDATKNIPEQYQKYKSLWNWFALNKMEKTQQFPFIINNTKN